MMIMTSTITTLQLPDVGILPLLRQGITTFSPQVFRLLPKGNSGGFSVGRHTKETQRDWGWALRGRLSACQGSLEIVGLCAVFCVEVDVC